MTILSGNGGGFIFRDDYRLRVSPDGSFDLVNQTDILAASSFSPAIKGGLDQTNQLTIIAHKHAIYLYINNQFIAQIEDSTSSYGTVGVIRTKYATPPDIRFDKVQVF